MNLTSAQPFWAVKNGICAAYPALDQDVICEAVIIGGGVTGALVAAHLIQEDIDTVLIDSRDIGTGSTSASTGLLQYEIDVPLRVLADKIGFVAAGRSYCLCCEAIDKLEAMSKRTRIDCAFERKPSLHVSRYQYETAGLREEYVLRKKLGFDLQFLDSPAIRSRFGFARPAGLFSRAGAQMDPHRLTHGLLISGQRRGLRVYDRTTMARLKQTSRGVHVTTRSGYRITARRAVVAAGFESKELLEAEAGRLCSTYALITEPLKESPLWYQNCLIWETGDPYLYMRTTEDRRVIIGGEDEPFVNGRRRDALISAKVRTLLKKFGRLFPDLAVEVAFAWAGTFARTKDGLPYIGIHPRFPHTYFALGYGGNGITFSIIAAEIIRDAFLGRPNKDAALFGFGR